MRVTTPTLWITAIFLLVCLSACARQPKTTPGYIPEAPPITHALGDTQIRETDNMPMVCVPAGHFLMGSDIDQVNYARQLCRDYSGMDMISVCRMSAFANEMPKHPVELSAFWLDRFEVTNQQYQLCVDEGTCTPPIELGSFTRDDYYGSEEFDSYPVVWVTQDQANEYCRWAGRRLPTEAEWEYAARGPENLIFPWGNNFDPQRLNYCDADCAAGVIDPSHADGYPETAPVGSFPNGASWCGALDLAENVREWVADGYHYYSADPQMNPSTPAADSNRIPRGGGWLDTPDDVRSANRGENTPDYTRHKVGFRCALSVFS